MPPRVDNAIQKAVGAVVLMATCLSPPGEVAWGADPVDAVLRQARSGAAGPAGAAMLRVWWAIESADEIVEAESEARPTISSAAATMPVAAIRSVTLRRPTATSAAQSEITRTAATIAPKSSPVPRKYQPFPGFETPAAVPTRPDYAGTPTNDAPNGTLTTAPGSAQGPVPPLSNYALPPGRYVGAEILRLANDLESTRIATRPGREIGLR